MSEILADPVVVKLKSVAQRLNAIVISDGPQGDEAKSRAYRDVNGSERLYIVEPRLKVLRGDEIENVPASSYVAAIFATTPYYESPSNRVIDGILGTERPVSFALDDPLSEGQVKNSYQMATIVRQDGFRLWGNRGTGDQTDLKTDQIQKVRIADAIKEALIASHRWAVAKNLGASFFEAVISSVNAFLSDLQALGAIAGGECFANPEKNTPTNLFKDLAYFQYKFTPATSSETLEFEETITDQYFQELAGSL